MTNYKHFALFAIILATVLSLIIRFYFYVRYSYSPVSDPSVFTEAARKIASGQGISHNFMASFFPYLVAYENILGIVMKAVTDPWRAVIILNTIFDIGGAVIVYFFVKMLAEQKSYLPALAFAIWILSPFNILFSITALPIIIVNFFIILSIYVAFLLMRHLHEYDLRLTILLSAILGFSIGIGNCFRPVFTVIFIALALTLLYSFYRSPKTRKGAVLYCSSLLFVFGIFSGVQSLNSALISHEVHRTIASNPSGWSIYVGSNWETSGNWSEADVKRMTVICKDSLSKADYTGCHKDLRKAGISRYKSYGIKKDLVLMSRKTYAYASNQSIVYNADQSVVGYLGSRTSKIFNVYTILFIIVLFYLSARFLLLYARVELLKNTNLDLSIILLSLVVLGFTVSTLGVESAPRYAQILYPVFVIFATLSIKISGRLKATQ